jgi:TetR/AcrR family transcriptional regulator
MQLRDVARSEVILAQHEKHNQARSIATRQAILDAALEAFARSGFQATSTRAIAENAKVHHASLRYYFADKEQLWRAAIRHMFDRQQSIFRQDQADNPVDVSTLAGVKEMVRRFVRYSARHPEHAQILVHESIASTARLDWAIDMFVRQNTARMDDRITDQGKAGHLRLTDRTLAVMLASAASQMVFVLSSHLQRIYGEDVRSPAFVERVADAIITLFFVDNAPVGDGPVTGKETAPWSAE